MSTSIVMTTIQHSSPLLTPSTPAASHHSRYTVLAPNYRPANPSPLASPSTPKSSPVAAAQARRRAQYKNRTPSTPIASSSNVFPSPRTISPSGGSVFYGGSTTPTPIQDPQKSFLREKFKAKCFARAAKAREKAIRGRRYDLSSDGFDDVMDEDEDDDDNSIMDDELFRRIMSNVERKSRHSYRVSYALDVGSSFDPDIEDVNEWEQELADGSHSVSVGVPNELTPIDFEDEELEAYAEEYAKQTALADFEDIADECLYDWSDLEEVEEVARGLNTTEDAEMEL